MFDKRYDIQLEGSGLIRKGSKEDLKCRQLGIGTLYELLLNERIGDRRVYTVLSKKCRDLPEYEFCKMFSYLVYGGSRFRDDFMLGRMYIWMNEEVFNGLRMFKHNLYADLKSMLGKSGFEELKSVLSGKRTVGALAREAGVSESTIRGRMEKWVKEMRNLSEWYTYTTRNGMVIRKISLKDNEDLGNSSFEIAIGGVALNRLRMSMERSGVAYTRSNVIRLLRESRESGKPLKSMLSVGDFGRESERKILRNAYLLYEK